MALQINESNFEQEVLRSSVPVMVDFWATWCGPCRMLAPIVDKLATETAGEAKVVKVDVDACPNLANSFEIRNIPTLIFFKDGKAVDRIVGATSLDNMLAHLRACK